MHPRDRTILMVVITTAAIVFLLGVFGRNPLSLVHESTPKEIWQFCVELGLSILVSILAHAFIRSWLFGCVVAGLSFSLLVQAISYFSLGYLDAFFMIAFVVVTLFGFAVAAVIGLFFHFARRREL